MTSDGPPRTRADHPIAAVPQTAARPDDGIPNDGIPDDGRPSAAKDSVSHPPSTISNMPRHSSPDSDRGAPNRASLSTDKAFVSHPPHTFVPMTSDGPPRTRADHPIAAVPQTAARPDDGADMAHGQRPTTAHASTGTDSAGAPRRATGGVDADARRADTPLPATGGVGGQGVLGLRRMSRGELGALSRDELAEVLGGIERLSNRLAGYRVEVLGALDALDRSGAAPDAAPRQALRDAAGMSDSDARRTNRIAGKARTKPSVLDALASGSINPAQAEALCDAEVPEAVRSELVAAAEAEDTDQTRRHVRDAESLHRPLSPQERHKRQRNARGAGWARDQEGMLKLWARFDPETGARIHAALEPLRRAYWAADKQQRTGRRTPAQRDADTLAYAVAGITHRNADAHAVTRLLAQSLPAVPRNSTLDGTDTQRPSRPNRAEPSGNSDNDDATHSRRQRHHDGTEPCPDRDTGGTTDNQRPSHNHQAEPNCDGGTADDTTDTRPPSHASGFRPNRNDSGNATSAGRQDHAGRSESDRDGDAAPCATCAGRRDGAGSAALTLPQPATASEMQGDALLQQATWLPAAQISVLMDLDALRGATDEAGLTDAGTELATETVRRLACDAELIPIVLDGSGGSADVGRTRRTVPRRLRRALIARDRHCQWPGCNAPPSRCDAHHIIHWADGGPTNLGNLVLICHHHHHYLHEHGYKLVKEPDGTWTPVRPPPDTSPGTSPSHSQSASHPQSTNRPPRRSSASRPPRRSAASSPPQDRPGRSDPKRNRPSARRRTANSPPTGRSSADRPPRRSAASSPPAGR